MPAAAAFDHANSSASSTGAVAGSAFIPGEDAVLKGNTHPTMGPRPAFYYFAHPDRWQVIDGKVLPLLGTLKLRAGVDAVSPGRLPGQVNAHAAKVSAQQKRRTLIPFESIPDTHATPGQEKSYLRRLDGRPDVVLSIYELAFPGSAETRCDTKRWVEFLQHQVDAKVVPDVATHVLEGMLEERIKRMERMSEGKDFSPKSARYLHLGKQVEVLKARLAERLKDVQPAAGSSVSGSAFEDGE